MEELKMADTQNYIQWIRSKVGHEKIILIFAGGCIFNKKGEVLLQRRGDSNKWGFPGGAIELGETPQMTAIREAKKETLELKYFALDSVPALFCKQHEELLSDIRSR